ncbi:MAG: hypothetical protein U0599_02520 [Vicinamibacteria bacterium]
MKSADGSEPLDLSRIVTTPEDVEALRRARRLPAMTTEAYLEWLAAHAASTEALRRRKGPGGSEPFRL